MVVLISLVCLMMSASSALVYGTDIYFAQRDFHGDQVLPVYYGQGHDYGRSANGWTKASADEALCAAGVRMAGR